MLGYIVRWPLGGMVWSNLHYLMGLSRLGHDVYFVEDSDDYPSCYDPSKGWSGTDPTYGLNFAGRVLGRIGLGQRWAYYDGHTSRWLGPLAESIAQICSKADVILNLAGVNPLRPWLQDIPHRTYVDEDPAYTQVRILTDPRARKRALQHTVFVSFGENIGLPQCRIPDDGLPWQPTRQPVVLDALDVMPPPPGGKYTTVMQWESYRALEYGGVRYGMKSDSFLPFLGLPAKAGPVFQLVIGGNTAPRRLLRSKGWLLCDPLKISRDPWTYEAFISSSKAEFGIVKHGYVVSRSGWFSERSACYLASGRPVMMQDTGFTEWLPAGCGLLAFSTPAQALAAMEDVNSDYRRHAQAARELAAEYFDARKVLSELIARIVM